MKKFKSQKLNKKIIAAISLSILAGVNFPVYASNEVRVESGTDSENLARGENNGTIEAEEEFDYVKYSKAVSLGENLNRSFYAMAALVQDTGEYAQPGFLAGGSYAYLVNNGTINLHYQDIVAAYANQLDIYGDTTRKYDNIMGWGMLAGEYSTLINNGTINFYYDEEDADATYGIFSHPMYVYENGAQINNGTVNVTGTGSAGAQVRGLTTEHSYVTNINNGRIYIDVEKSFMSRALATTGNYGSLINNGEIFNRSSGVVYGMSAPSVGTFENHGTINVISYGIAPTPIAGVQAAQIPGAFGMVNSPVGAGTFTNTGVINVRVPSTEDTDAGAISSGMMIFNTASTGTITLENTGVINASSDIAASASNQYLPRVSEISVHSLLPRAGARSRENANLVIGNYATNLRDFGATQDLIHARWANIDFSQTNLILRPSENYTAGTAYEISSDTLVTKITDETFPDAEVTVGGIDSMRYSAEMSDFLTTNVEKVSDGVYRVSLVPNSNVDTKKLISAAAMGGVDFTRANLDQISHELERNDRLQQKWFITPYYSKFKRSEGLNGRAHGFIAGSDWKIGEKSFLGIHAAYALGGGDNGIYSADAKLKSFLGGVHWTIYPQENKNWVRTQATFFHNSGDTSYIMNTDTNTLSGKSSNKSNGFYLSANYGFRNELSEQNELRTELGWSYLNMSDSPTINWSLQGENISGYDMKFDKYNSLFATAKTSLIHDFNENGSLLFSLGVRGRLAGKKVKMNMMNTNFGDSVKEDSVQGLVELSYRQKISKFYIDAGYQGIFGSKVKNHLLHAALKWSF